VIGTTVGSYRITQKISIGGMGTVYKAEHTLIGKHAAVKVLHPELRANREVVDRFFNEAKATTRIKHPGIVEVFDFGYLPSGDGYIVMEFLEGMSLAKRVKTRGQIDEGEAAMILRGVCSALAAAHEKKIVHRDLKPDNIFITPDPDSQLGERPKLLDFGIAKLTDANLAGSGTATKTGAVMGTPTYMSPEQCKGTGNVDHRSDLYSIGCIFYELVCGVPPFESEGAGELIGAHLYKQPDPPSQHVPGISKESEKLMLALLEKQPEKRPQTARELGQLFSKIAQAHGWITHTNPAGMSAVRHSAVDVPPVPSKHEEETAPTMASDPNVTPPPPPQPTTLSLAASASVVDMSRKRRRGFLIAGIGAAVAAIGAVAVITMTGGDDGNKKPAAAPAPVAAPAAAPVPAPAPAPDPVPAAVTPPPAPPAPPPVVKPPPAPPAPPPAATPPPKKPPIATTKPPQVAKQPPKKPPTETKPPQGTGSGSAKKTLIETDL
jgi:serine/threonine protein kinase